MEKEDKERENNVLLYCMLTKGQLSVPRDKAHKSPKISQALLTMWLRRKMQNVKKIVNSPRFFSTKWKL